MHSNDEKAMLQILGPDGKRIVSSGDETEDAESRANFVWKYQQMHRLFREPDGTTTLYIGAENWPTPIPLMNKGNSWYFDTEAGEKEILFRRIGRNEMSAIRVCQQLVAAEKEYYASHNEYAQRIFSDAGQHDGLYWKVAGGEPESSHRTAGGSGRLRGLSRTPKWRAHSLPRLLLSRPHAPGKKRPWRREKLHQPWQNDRRFRFRAPIRRNIGRPA